MFPLLGRLFSFVQKDVEEKEQILMKLHAANENGYETVGKMIATECGDSSKPQELGCRTLLRLHRCVSLLLLFAVYSISTFSSLYESCSPIDHFEVLMDFLS